MNEGKMGVETLNKMMRNTERLRFLPERSALLSAFLVVGNMSVMIRGKMIRTWFGGIPLMKLVNNIVSMCEIGGGGPLVFFISAFITSPVNIVEQFARGPAS